MNIKINSVHFEADTQLKDLISSKLQKLTQYHDGITNVEVFLKLENSQDQGNKVVEAKLEIPQHKLFAKKQTESFEKSADEVIAALKKQILKHKEKKK